VLLHEVTISNRRWAAVAAEIHPRAAPPRKAETQAMAKEA